ncbi:hypothetical protein [Variovorax saccharolyticus]|uniref:hypothetical protein n=1 Tax=Variovorax saccharolyticus TaxID=3053516 RepID=UPI002574B1D6|nr:hypothetical protein [Variovorax sp. J31P216]MDM0030055.1 hypothetical protein [Variovorax sp. J31P216]
MPHTPVEPTIVRALARYLGAHPLASDTSLGITQWWLHDQGSLREADVWEALEWLQRSQLVERIVAPDGRVRFRRNAAIPDDAWRRRLHEVLQTLPLAP